MMLPDAAVDLWPAGRAVQRQYAAASRTVEDGEDRRRYPSLF